MDEQLFDSADYAEIVIRHIVRDAEVFNKAKSLGVVGDDFLTSKVAGIRAYKEFVDTAMEIGSAPIDPSLFWLHIKSKQDKGLFYGTDEESIKAFYDFIYSGSLHASRIASSLKGYLRRRRYINIKNENGDDPERQFTELSKMMFTLETGDTVSQTTTINPFQTVVTRGKFTGIPTGFNTIDSEIGGLGFEEFALILGHSGSGKTAVATSIMYSAAFADKKVLYMSAEEPAVNIANRLYAKHFQLDYSKLHKGEVTMELQQCVSEMSEFDRDKLTNIRIEDIREITPAKCSQLKMVAEKLAAEGFFPDLIIVDQMEFLESETPTNSRWEKFEVISNDCHYFSSYKIAGQKSFALYVLHQVSGKMSLDYTNAEISGFKGVIKPTSLALALGRESPTSDLARIFSLKARHTKNFSHDYIFEGAHMSYSDIKDSAAHKQKMEAKKAEEDSRKQLGGRAEVEFANTPSVNQFTK